MNPDHYHHHYSRGGGGGGHRYNHHVPPSRPHHDYHGMGYGVRCEEEKVELEDHIPPPPPPQRQQSALDQCMNERTSRRDYHGQKPPTRSFYDTAYDDVLARKQQEYAPRSRGSMDAPVAPRPRTNNETMIELGPGKSARLRGAAETWHCVENDFHVPVICFACSLELCCIQDADYVLCPQCKVVSPIEQQNGHADGNDGGVGLGFTFEELFKWQSEIMRRREEQQNNCSRPPPPHQREVYY